MMRRLLARHGSALLFYVVIGGASALVEWTVFWGLLEAAALHYLVAAAVAFVAATFVNYLLCIKTIFVSKTRSAWKDLTMVYAASLVGLVVNLSTLALLVSGFGVDEMVSKVAGTGAAFLFNFASRRLVIFGQRATAPSLLRHPGIE